VRIAITPGEPAGIGPDVALMIANRSYDADLVFIADKDLLFQRADELGIALPNNISIFHQPLNSPVVPGELNPNNVPYVLNSIELAARACLENEFDAMVTGPVNKEVINKSGISFSGHTEFLREITGAEHAVMMLATNTMRVALLTTHLPLSKVPENITAERLEETLLILHQTLQNPRILVCGLNPHAGEGGFLGSEEVEIISPVIKRLIERGLNLIGPLPADTAFTKNNLENADVILTMYHDQGLPVLKSVGFGESVNITLGLPIIRTSVDHGTALDLAGTGKANCESLHFAIETAIEMVRNKRH